MVDMTLSGRRIDDGDVVVQTVGDIEALAVWREQNAARIVADRNPREHIICRGRKIVDERLPSRAHRFQQAGDVNDGDALRSCRGQEDLRFVRRDRHAPRQGVVAVEFVDRDLNCATNIVAKQSERIAEGPAVLDVRQRDQILGPQLRGHAQAAICGQSDVKNARHVVQRFALDDYLPLGIDDGDF